MRRTHQLGLCGVQPIRGSVCSREGMTASRGHRGGAFQRRGVQQFLPAQEFRKTHTSSMLGLMCWDRLPGSPPSGHKHLLGQSSGGGGCVSQIRGFRCVCHCIVFIRKDSICTISVVQKNHKNTQGPKPSICLNCRYIKNVLPVRAGWYDIMCSANDRHVNKLSFCDTPFILL